MGRGKFIVLEGIDGSGKSTQAKLIADYLKEHGHPTILTFEPTKGPIGAMIRSIFSHTMQADQHTIAGLFLADRFEHILNPEDGMLATLEKGINIVCDRYYFSSYAYHSVYMPVEWVIAANSRAAELLRPDLALYVKVSPETSMARINANRTHIEMYETIDNLRLVENNYKRAFELVQGTENIVAINGEQTQDQVFEAAIIEVKKVLGI